MSYSGNLLVENRNGLIVDAEVFQANGTAERDAALVMLEQVRGTKAVTVGGDKGFDTSRFRGGVPAYGSRHRTWRRTMRGPGAAPLMATPRGTRGTPSARERGSGSKNASAG